MRRRGAWLLCVRAPFLAAPIAALVDSQLVLTRCSHSEHAAAWSRCLQQLTPANATSACATWSPDLHCCSASRLSELPSDACDGCERCVVNFRCHPSWRHAHAIPCPNEPPTPPPPPPYLPFSTCVSWGYCSEVEGAFEGWLFFMLIIFVLLGFSTRSTWIPQLRAFIDRSARHGDLRSAFSRSRRLLCSPLRAAFNPSRSRSHRQQRRASTDPNAGLVGASATQSAAVELTSASRCGADPDAHAETDADAHAVGACAPFPSATPAPPPTTTTTSAPRGFPVRATPMVSTLSVTAVRRESTPAAAAEAELDPRTMDASGCSGGGGGLGGGAVACEGHV